MANIYLVRHTEYFNPGGILPGRLPVELSDKGLEQAQNLALFFKEKMIVKIYSSPVFRCMQTSEIISQNIIPIVADLRLAETFSVQQGAKHRNDWRYQLYAQVPILGGESSEDVQKRMVNFWKNANFEDGKNYIICSHGDPLLFLFEHLNDEPLHIDLNVNEPFGYQPKGSVRLIEIQDSKVLKIHPFIEV